MKKVYISPKSKLLSLEPETMIAGSATNPEISETSAEIDPGSGSISETSAQEEGVSVIMEGREVIRTQSAWDNEW